MPIANQSSQWLVFYMYVCANIAVIIIIYNIKTCRSYINTISKHNQFHILDIDDCDPNPCENGGTCGDLVSGYQCQCVDGYTGLYCQTSELTTIVL